MIIATSVRAHVPSPTSASCLSQFNARVVFRGTFRYEITACTMIQMFMLACSCEKLFDWLVRNESIKRDDLCSLCKTRHSDRRVRVLTGTEVWFFSRHRWAQIPKGLSVAHSSSLSVSLSVSLSLSPPCLCLSVCVSLSLCLSVCFSLLNDVCL